MDKTELRILVDNFFGKSLGEAVVNAFTDYLWPNVESALEDERMDGYDSGYYSGYDGATCYLDHNYGD
jgi:hypothetical protein